jgi:hypothetical protein
MCHFVRKLVHFRRHKISINLYLELAGLGDGAENLGDDQLPPAIGVGKVHDRPGVRHDDIALTDGV